MIEGDGTLSIDLIPAQGYLHVVVTGEETLANLRRVWSRIAHMSREADADLILCEGYLEGEGNTTDLFDFAAEFAQIWVSRKVRIAVVCEESKLPDFQFAETVVVNRGTYFVNVFTDTELALNWLRTPEGSTR